MKQCNILWASVALAALLSGPAARAEAEAPPRYEDVFNNARAAWPEPEGRNADEARIDDDVLYVLGNIANTMFHEFGHGFVSEFELPIVGKEEDAVDALANVIMVSESDSPYLDRMIETVADDWFAQGQFDEEEGAEPSPWDVHSPNAARAGAVICILVGADPELFKEAADNAGMPPERQESCQGDYEQAQQSWDKLLEPHYLKDGETPTNKVTVTYVDAPAELQPIAEFVKASGIVDDIAEQVEGTFRLPNPISISVQACGEENAFWSPDDHRVTLCYEIVKGYYDRAVAEAN